VIDAVAKSASTGEWADVETAVLASRP